MTIYITPIRQYIIDAVFTLRTEKKIGQEELAQILGLSKSFVGNVESIKSRCSYNLDHVDRLSKYFKLPPSCFFPSKGLSIEKVPKRKPELLMKKQV